MNKKYSSLRSAQRLNLVEQIPIEFPWSVYIEPTNRCNFSCVFCPISSKDYLRQGGGEMMTNATFQTICDQIEEGGRLKALRLYMLGEPLLNKRIIDFIAEARRRNLAERIELTSNGAPLKNASLRSQLLASGLDYLRISVYGTTLDEHRQLTQSNSDPLHIRASLAALKSERDRTGSALYIYAKLIDSGDLDQINRFKQQYDTICDEAEIEPPMNWDGQGDYLSPIFANTDPSALHALFPHKKVACPFPFYTAVVHVNGDVSLCCVDWSKMTKVGNIHTRTLMEIWNGPEAVAFRLLHLSGKRNQNTACSKCSHLFTSPDNIDDLLTS
ncbi:MAG: SPASM domain-containing protein [Sulfuritalea sp.]|jgi:radical SAM protein with 4Fe4S-binding SPASM domain|nr:SPASM domain-containing protein [Sulfuritalea sp.]